jgi:hypothetical protein
MTSAVSVSLCNEMKTEPRSQYPSWKRGIALNETPSDASGRFTV